MSRESWGDVLSRGLQAENLANSAVARSVGALVQAISSGELEEAKATALLLRVCQEAFQTLKDAPHDASLLQTCAALATALANNRELPPKAITSALKLHGFFVACVSRSMDLAMFKTFTHIVRWQASLSDSESYDEEAYTKLALHLLAAIPALFKANQSITPDAIKIAAAWLQGFVPRILARMKDMRLPDALARPLQSTLQSLLATACTLATSIPQLSAGLCALVDAVAQTRTIGFLQMLALVRRYAGSTSAVLLACFQSLYSSARAVWAAEDSAIIGMLVVAEDIQRTGAGEELTIWSAIPSLEFRSRINQMLALALAELASGCDGKDARRRRPWELVSSSDTSAWIAALVGVTDPPQAELITKIIVCCTEQLLAGVRRPAKNAAVSKRTSPKSQQDQPHQHLHSMMSFALRLLEAITAARDVSLHGVCDRCVRQVMRAVTMVADYAHEPAEPCTELCKVLENLTAMCFALFPAVGESLYQTLSRCVQTNLHRLHRLEAPLSNDFMARLLAMPRLVRPAAEQEAEYVAMLSAAARILPAEAACNMLLATLATHPLQGASEHALISQPMSLLVKGLCSEALSLGQASSLLVATIRQSPLQQKQKLLLGLFKAVSHNSIGLVGSDATLTAVDELLVLLEQDCSEPISRCLLAHCRAHLVWAAQARMSGDEQPGQLQAFLDKTQPQLEQFIQGLSGAAGKKQQTNKKLAKASRNKQKAPSSIAEGTDAPEAVALSCLMQALLWSQWQLQQRYHNAFAGSDGGAVDTDELLQDSASEATSDEESDDERSCHRAVKADDVDHLPTVLAAAQAAVCTGPYKELLNQLQTLIVPAGFISGVEELQQLCAHLDSSTAETEGLLLWAVLHVNGPTLLCAAEPLISPTVAQQYWRLIASPAANREEYEECLTSLARVQSSNHRTAPQDLADMIKFLAAAKLALAAGDLVSAARFGRYVVLSTNNPFDKAHCGQLSLPKLAIRTEALLLMAEVWDCIGTPDSAVAYLTQADKLAHSTFPASSDRLADFQAKSARLWTRLGQPDRVSGDHQRSLSLDGSSFPTFLQAWNSFEGRTDRPELRRVLQLEMAALTTALEQLPPVIFVGLANPRKVHLPELPIDVLREELPRCSFDAFRDACRMLSLRYLLDPNVSAESVWRCAAASINPSAAGQLFRRSGVLDSSAVPEFRFGDCDSLAPAFWDATLFMPDNGSHLSEIKQMLFSMQRGPHGADASTTFVCSLGCKILLLGRLSAEGAPLTVALQCEEKLVSILETWQELMERNKEQLHGTRDAQALQKWTTQLKQAWWADRHKLDDDVSECLDQLQSMLGPWRCLLGPQDSLPDEKCTKHLRQLVEEIVAELSTGSGKKQRDDMLASWVTTLLLAFPMLSEEEVLQGVRHIMSFRAGSERIPPQAVEIIEEAIRFVESCNDHFSLGNQPMSAFDAALESAAEASEASEETDEPDWNAMSVTQLRESLKAADLPTAGRKAELIARLQEHYARQRSEGKEKEEASLAATSSKSKCSILMLDERIQSICVESMPTMRKVAAFRMPGLSLLEELLSRRQSAQALSVQRAWYVIDPENNLPTTRKTMSDFLSPYASRWGWSGYVAEAPPKDVVQDLHEHSEAFIYCGHGAGERLCQRQKLERFSACPAAFLWGCSSGRLQQKGVHDPTGAAVSYLLAGAPLVIGNLWDVTDRDIDRVSMECMRLLFDSAEGAKAPPQVPLALVTARDACKLYYAVGCAAVCYGLPTPILSEK